MARISEKPSSNEYELDMLYSWSNSKTQESRLVERAKIILLCLDGYQDTEVADELDITPMTVGKWRRRFIKFGIGGLYDSARSGKRPKYDPEGTRNAILKTLEKPPPKGQATWDGESVASELGISAHKVWRILRAEGICLQRHRTWCVSTDPEFTSKAAEIIGLYLNPPENAIVLSIDEKPSIQAIERATGYVRTSNGKVARGLKSTYIRHGTVNLFAALEVATGFVRAQITNQKKRVDFLGFMDQIVADIQPEQEVHVILDNYCIHKKNHDWLNKHPNVHFHFTPTSASWLNMVEILFGILSRKAIKGASFKDKAELTQAIQDFLDVYNERAEPFVWRKREVRGTQLRNTITNLCN